MKQLSKDQTNRVIGLLNSNYSIRKISKNVGASKSSVHKIRKEQNIDIIGNLGGQYSMLNVQNKIQIIREITSGKVSNSVEASKSLNEGLNVQVRYETIRRILKSAGLRSNVKKKKPRLSNKHRRERMLWAQKYKNWTLAKMA